MLNYRTPTGPRVDATTVTTLAALVAAGALTLAALAGQLDRSAPTLTDQTECPTGTVHVWTVYPVAGRCRTLNP